MTRHKRISALVVGSIAGILQIGTGVYAVVATISMPSTSAFYIAAVTCGLYSLSAIANIVSSTRSRSSKSLSSALLTTSLVPLVLTGVVLALVTLESQRTLIGLRFCGRDARTSCAFAGNRALLTYYMLWFLGSLAQAIYVVLSLTGEKVAITPMRQVNIDHVPSPVRSPTPAKVMRATTTRRVPLLRQITSDEPFSYEEALQAKAATTAPTQGGHQATLSSSSHQSNTTFVQSHMSQVSYSRSWASTLPTAVSGASPRSIYSSRKHNFSDDTTRTHSKKSSPEKNDWLGWGIALSSPAHKTRQENVSLSTACSRTSSRPTHAAQSPSNLKFHLPSSPELRQGFTSPRMIDAEVQSSERPGIKSMHSASTASDGTSAYDSPPASPASRLRTPSFAIDARLALFPSSITTNKSSSNDSHNIKHNRRNSRKSSEGGARGVGGLEHIRTSSLTRSPERKRASILGSIKPRLPDARAFRRNSWIPSHQSKSHANTNTINTTTTNTSPAKSWSSTEDAFTTWDTSTVEQELVLAPASRDCTPRVLSLQTPADERDEESLWGNRDVRVASDGSVFTRAQDDFRAVQKLSSRLVLEPT